MLEVEIPPHIGHLSIPEVEFIALSDDTEEAELAQMDGVAAVPMSSGDTLYLGAVFKVGDKKPAINYFDYKRAALLEYDVAVYD